MDKERKIAGVSKTVFSLGIVSLLTDVSSEMLVPIVPQFLKFVVGASTPIIGLIEGIAESTASILRVHAGYLADKTGRPKLLTVIGYGLSALSKPFYLVANAWPGVLGIRFADRFGKGIRSAPRDVLIADTTPEDQRGRAFGLHRAMDTTGAMLGPLVIILLVMYFFGRQFLVAPGPQHLPIYHLIFLAAAVPAVLGWLVLVFFVKEQKREETSARPVKLGMLCSGVKQMIVVCLLVWVVVGFFQLKPLAPGASYLSISIYVGVALLLGAAGVVAILFGPTSAGRESAFMSLPLRYRVFLGIVTLFSIGNSSDAFLVLRACSPIKDGGVGVETIMFLWVYAAFNGLSALVSLRSGIVSDKVGRRPMIIIGWLIFALVYFAMARISTPTGVWIWFIIYGIYYGLTEGMLRAYAVDLAPANLRGTAVGAYFTFTGVALLPASVIAGFLWKAFGSGAPFYYGAATAVAATVLMVALVKPGTANA